MDAKLQTIHRHMQAEDDKMLVLARVVDALLRERTNNGGTPLTDEELQSMQYGLDEAFNFEL